MVATMLDIASDPSLQPWEPRPPVAARARLMLTMSRTSCTRSCARASEPRTIRAKAAQQKCMLAKCATHKTAAGIHASSDAAPRPGALASSGPLGRWVPRCLRRRARVCACRWANLSREPRDGRPSFQRRATRQGWRALAAMCLRMLVSSGWSGGSGAAAVDEPAHERPWSSLTSYAWRS